MKYTKPALTFEQQTQRLLDRGLIADKTAELLRLVPEIRTKGVLAGESDGSLFGVDMDGEIRESPLRVVAASSCLFIVGVEPEVGAVESWSECVVAESVVDMCYNTYYYT